MNTAMASHPHSHGVGKSISASLIFVAMLLAALSLWTALPLTWVYIGSKVSKTQFPAEAPYAVVIVGLIISIVLVAWLISRLNRLYVDVTGCIARWREAVSKYEFIRGGISGFRYLDYYTALATVRGAEARKKQAVAFDIEPYGKRRVLDEVP